MSNKTDKSDQKPSGKTDADHMRKWMDDVGGSVFPGKSTLKSVEVSKSGDKLTIVLKKNKKEQNSNNF